MNGCVRRSALNVADDRSGLAYLFRRNFRTIKMMMMVRQLLL
jgi:hypothetical protein